MKRYGLDNSSSVQNALRNLYGDNLNMVTMVGRSHYKLQDKFFELWLAQMNHVFDGKIASVEKTFKDLRAIGVEAKATKCIGTKG